MGRIPMFVARKWESEVGTPWPPEMYERYLVNGFREAWAFTGSPLRLKFTARGSKR
jgi:predicted GTPase